MAQRKALYGFFDNIKEYLDQEKNFDSELEIGSDHFCAYIKDHSGKFPQITKYCKEFVNFFTFLKENIIRDSDLLLYNQYHEFLNYWLNDKLRGSSITDADREAFYKDLEASYYWFDWEEKLKAETDCSDFLKYCKDNYTIALKKCYDDRDVDFCEALKGFRSLYENNKSSDHSKCSTVELPLLPEITSHESSKIINMSKVEIGNAIIDPTQIHTNLDLSKIRNQKYDNLRKLISVHYNILEVYDKNEQKISMMNILNEYLQYCNANSTRSDLILFIEEFFNNYYYKKKNVYDEIYKDCSVDTQSQKDYCEIYKKCITEFKCDFSLIEQNPEEYVNNKKELHQKMNKGGLWMENIARFFEKTSDISSSASVITGTVVALFFTTFALYKFTPVGRLCNKKKKKVKNAYNYEVENIEDLFDYNKNFVNIDPSRNRIRLSYYPS
ncbi:unnamed protein product [Plasmodium vivax]|uniref:(malaria parasite P. vivax) hypothetical protein n=1 Tax=Plasmodium vivax TaxID=5855 RepID=A0A8S4HK34_PLAVI|nr:unnamed protein product [Plasmodium vivax]